MVDMIAVDSSMIRAVGYDEETRCLYVEFNNRDMYKYSEVELRIFNSMMTAESIGKYFDANIKKKDYKFTKIK